jgi:hypothetical protein
MADEPIPAPQNPAATQAAAPAAAPAAAATPSENPAPAPVTPPTSPASAPNATETAASPAQTKQAETLLSVEPTAKTDAPAETPAAANKEAAPAEAAKPEDKKDEAPKDGEQKKEDGSQSADPAPQPTYEAFKLEDGFTVDDAKLGEFTGLLAEMELAKGDHTKVQETGQKLVDRHIAEVKSVLQRQNEFYLNAFEKQKTDWLTAFEKDPEIGGNQQETSKEAARNFISQHAGTPEQQKEFRDLMQTTGVGNHPAMIRLLAKAQKSMTLEGSPVPAQNLSTAQKSKVEKRYGKMS